MDILFDAKLWHSFWADLETAQRRAFLEAANTGGAILEVCSIEIQRSSLVFIGSVPTVALEIGQREGRGRPRIRSQGLGTFHTTWGALMKPEDTIGFFVLRQPVRLVGGCPPAEEQEIIRVAIDVKRRFASLPPGFIGPVCCLVCNEAISELRLKAIPGVRTCTNCQCLKEGKKK